MGERLILSPIFFLFCMEERNPVSIVHEIFNNFFGEENVDLQESTILVHFPKVTVTNENDRSIDITHLWVKIELGHDGTIQGVFQMMRSEYTTEQFISGYCHSHMPPVNSENFNRWNSPCLGQGPIRTTITSLSTNFSEEIWELFCLELSKYVTIESLTGGPYMLLERVGACNENSLEEEEIINFPLQIFRDSTFPNSDNYNRVIRELISVILDKKPFGFNFTNGSYGIAMSDKAIFITLSNLFIEYYNSLPSEQKIPKETLFDEGIIHKGKCIGPLKRLYYVRHPIYSNTGNYTGINGIPLFRFKDETISLNIMPPDITLEEDSNTTIFLSDSIVKNIIDILLREINTKYGRISENSSSREEHRYI